jgi:Uma2 family endonuclease
MTRLLVTDSDQANAMIEERKRLGLDHHDEVWEGMYVMPSMPSLDHQKLVRLLATILGTIVDLEQSGEVYPGANVSDRRKDWKENFRVPDVVLVLKKSRAVLCDTVIVGGPDFLVEIESPGDDTEEKVPFYSKIGVRELLIIHRDKRSLRLLCHDGQDLIEVRPTPLEGKDWLVSTVLPLAFRRTVQKGTPRTQVRRTDGQPGEWTV